MRDVRRLLLSVAVTVVGGAGLVTALGDGDEEGVGSLLAPSPPKVSVSYQPGAGGPPVNPRATIAVTATGGQLREVALTQGGGKPVKGALSDDRRTWTAGEPLAYGKSYTWTGTAVDPDGKTVPLGGSVTTVTPAKIVRGTLNIGDGRVVGVAAPIRIQFNGHVTDRAAAEKTLTVHTSVPTEGSWGWLPDEGGGSRVDWRPREYWQSGTKVTVTANLFGADYGAGAFGASDVSTTFTIGRAQLTRADVRSHELVVLRDGREVARYPASYGLDSDPNRNTRSGIHVVTEKFTDKRMVSQQYGYDVMEKWAVRMSNNGEFIHANPQTVGVQGSSNVSHGCVNLSLDDARQYYDGAVYGDPVEVTGSGVQLSAKDGDIWDWTLSWADWQRLSALKG
ncbi:L,D-transpeptidase LdtMt5 [Pseudonocardia eucalypti]|uniref:L,D-transpeptidase LdtMt5 n=1 Tax=Pseudonocardia eucalypti TaxID=648755 RepID=A0ABP9Q5Z9_9PSEU|nr:lipoprotein-anchoring transpeptidase ErfK/SrfK [Pseudonocardia eucalypti]